MLARGRQSCALDELCTKCGQSYHFDKLDLRNRSSHQWVQVGFEGQSREESISWYALAIGSHAGSSHEKHARRRTMQV